MNRIKRALKIPIQAEAKFRPLPYQGKEYMVDSRIKPGAFASRMQRGPERGWPVERCCTEPPRRGISLKSEMPWEPRRLSGRVSKDQQAVIDAGRVRREG